jgi:hypothetical protein
MTRKDTLTCIHEPFGDAFYFGPERLSERYENDVKAREASGFANSTFKTIFERIEKESKKVRTPIPVRRFVCLLYTVQFFVVLLLSPEIYFPQSQSFSVFFLSSSWDPVISFN